MKVLVITPYNGGGMVQYAAQMASALSRRIEVVQIVGSGVDRSLFPDEVRLIEVDLPSSLAELGPSVVRTLSNLRSTIHRVEADVIHLTARNQLLLPLLPTFLSTRFVYTLHDVEVHTGEFGLIGEMSDRLLVQGADQVIVHGEYNRQEFIRKYGSPGKCSSIMHGDYSFYRGYCETDEVRNKPELLFFGRIRPYKDLETLVRAEQLLSDQKIEHRLTIAGAGSIDEAISRRISASEDITLLNEYISNKQVCKLFDRCRAVVLPYRDASQTGVVPIAYSFKKPVVASDVGGIPDVVEHGTTGYLVEPENPTAFADRCTDLLYYPALARTMGEQGDRFRRRYMNWEDIAEKILSIY